MRPTLHLAALTAAVAAAVQAAPIPEQRPPVGCTITAPPTVEQGQVPRITVALTNQTAADMYLVGSLDASDCKWRLPYCTFDITGPDGKSPVKGVSRCGNMNVLREKDFVKVAPGKSFDPYQRVDDGGFFSSHQLQAEHFAAPGEYRVRFHYATTAEKEPRGNWFGDGFRKGQEAEEARVKALLAQVPRVTVASNTITVRVVPAAK
ncbi:hypothetical protein [Urbifossiella limnaea]|uniref:Uncharacterized protein n=1 Tax=Urbifossiella limnaea TaxID=2528023 RepID=A0A517XNW1_9BACT|nr:hypothetical protein [Urbifossiella limnaea]QDU19188.1 hypothetical protein ETAA1_10920 [Urbifossiella limnaea]